MKLYNLSANDTSPCVVLKFKSCTIMMDCSLDLTSLKHFLPMTITDQPRLMNLPKWHLKDESGNLVQMQELKECAGKVFVDADLEFNLPETDLLDISTIDVILVSNSNTMMALPYITEYFGFKGTVYATEPTIQIGRLLMEELVQFCHNSPKNKSGGLWKKHKYYQQLPGYNAGCETSLATWRNCYSYDDVQTAVSKIHVVGYAELVSIFGALNVTAHSSGYSLGSCNWVIGTEFEKVVYISGSSSLVTHPQPLDQQPLQDSDVIIFTGLTHAPQHNPDNTLAEFFFCLAKTVKGGGNVLIPCLPTGLIYDLLECLLLYMEKTNIINIPIYLISPSAKASLALSQIYAEWLHPNKQNKSYLPETPFPHDQLVSLGRLKVFSSIHDGLSHGFKKPCIVFAGHPSLRMGDAVHFVEMWGKCSLNSIIFVEPSYSHLDALAPFQPLTARAFHFPIDTRTTHQAASRMIDSLNPRQVVVPPSYMTPPPEAPHHTELKLELKNKVEILNRNTVIKLNVKRSNEKVNLEPDLAASLHPTQMKPGVLAAPLSTMSTERNNKHLFKPIYKRVQTTGGGRKRKFYEEVSHRPLIYGKLEINAFVDCLKQEGFAEAKVESSSTGKMIILKDTIIQIEDGSTHIVCEGNESLRIKLRDILLKNLNSAS
nr:integrator complex subunit 9 isoform X1 [Ciona intestinalis]|eukprot:XP_002123221.1 integrator complex subunit 9 isoform X1 [Ciona intestinalis]